MSTATKDVEMTLEGLAEQRHKGDVLGMTIDLRAEQVEEIRLFCEKCKTAGLTPIMLGATDNPDAKLVVYGFSPQQATACAEGRKDSYEALESLSKEREEASVS